MQRTLTKSTSFGKRHLVFIMAIVFSVTCSALSQLPGWHTGAQTLITDQIAFDRNGDMYLINSDGTGLTSRGKGFGPAFSPDSRQIVFTFGTTVDTFVISKMRSDGTGRTQLTETFQEHQAAWSPDGTQIAFVSEREDPEYLPGEDLFTTPRLYLMDADGIVETKLIPRALSLGLQQEFAPTWSPDGSQLAFIGYTRSLSGSTQTNIYVVNRDGTGLRQVTRFTNGALIGADKISWSRNGLKIAFAMVRDIHVVNSDGLSDPVNLTNTADRDESDPVFSPGGGRIAYVVNHFNDKLKSGLYIMKSSGQNPTQILSAIDPLPNRPAWNPLSQDPFEKLD